MSYASRSGRARVSSTNPQAFGVCDRCGMWYNRVDLRNQMEWRGAALLPLYIYVCNDCYDVPQEQLRAIVVPADPIPIIQPRVEPFDADETTYMGLSGSTTDPVSGIPVPNTTAMETAGGVIMTPTPIGQPIGLEPGGIMPLALTNGIPTHYGVELPLVSVIADGTTVIRATCSTPHGLATNAQIAASGLANTLACGFYSVTPTTSTAFSYEVFSPVPAGSLLTSEARIVTAQVGLPLSYVQQPVVGPGSQGTIAIPP